MNVRHREFFIFCMLIAHHVYRKSAYLFCWQHPVPCSTRRDSFATQSPDLRVSHHPRQLARQRPSLLIRQQARYSHFLACVPQAQLKFATNRLPNHLHPRPVPPERTNAPPIVALPAEFLRRNSQHFIIIVMTPNNIECQPHQQHLRTRKWQNHPRPNSDSTGSQQKCRRGNQAKPQPSPAR